MRLSITPLDLLNVPHSEPARSVTQDIANDIPAEIPAVQPVRRRNTAVRIMVCVFAAVGFVLVSLVLLGSTLGCG